MHPQHQPVWRWTTCAHAGAVRQYPLSAGSAGLQPGDSRGDRHGRAHSNPAEGRAPAEHSLDER